MRARFLSICICASAVAAPALAASPKVTTPLIREVAVAATRVHVGDVVASAPAEIAQIDLGPAPMLGGSRVIDREEIARAIDDAHEKATMALPASVRILRKAKRLTAADVDRIVRLELDSGKLPRGASLSAVRAPASLDVPEGYEKVTVDLPRPPHRSGPFVTSAAVTFTSGREVLTRTSIPVELVLSTEAAEYDVARGATLVLVIRRGLVEVTTPASAATDGDIGSVVPITLHPSGRVIRAKLLDRDHALAMEGS